MIEGLLIAVVTIFSWLFLRAHQHQKRIEFLQSYTFPTVVKSQVNKIYTHLSDDEVNIVLESLRSFFVISLKAKCKPVAMPSKVVDVAWHQFILCTKSYEQFCKKGIGQFLHHTPTETMTSLKTAQEGMKRAWRLACYQDSVNPKAPKYLPMLFAIDSELKIEDGFYYSMDIDAENKIISKDSGMLYVNHIACIVGCLGDSGSCSDCNSDSCSDCSSSNCSSGCGGGGD